MNVQDLEDTLFVHMCTDELPAQWKQPVDPAHTCGVALRLGVHPSDIHSYVCLEVPKTSLGRQYHSWAFTNRTPRCVPVMVSCFSDFMKHDGNNRLAQFNQSIRNLGRPCHFVRVEGDNPEVPKSLSTPFFLASAGLLAPALWSFVPLLG